MAWRLLARLTICTAYDVPSFPLEEAEVASSLTQLLHGVARAPQPQAYCPDQGRSR
jgi:hypothetical protein